MCIRDRYQGEALNTPYHFIFHAAFDALYHWVRDGIPAPYAPKIITEMTYGPTDPTGVQVANRTDSFGNALGGIRYPAADCPTSVCQSYTPVSYTHLDVYKRQTPV